MLALVFATLLGAAPARAQEIAGPAGPASRGQPAGPYSLEDVLVMAKKNNHNIAAEKARLAQAQTNVETAWASLFPTVSAQGRYTRNYAEFIFGIARTDMNGQPVVDPATMRPIVDTLTIQPVNQLDGVISASMPILAPAAYPALNAVKAGVEAAEANYKVSEDDVLVAVARAFLAAAVSDEVLAARNSSITVANATLENAKTRHQAGTVTKVDVDRAELALVRAQQAAREAIYGREQAYRALGTLIGVDGPYTIRPEIPTAPLPDENDLAMALHLRPEFAAIEASIKSAQKTAHARGWQWAPTLSAFGNARIFNYDNFRRDSHAWAAGAQLDWALFDGGTRDAQRHAASAQARENEARSLALRDQIRDSMRDGASQLATKKRGLEAATRSVELAKETLELVRIQYESGVGTQLDLLAAQDSVVAAHLGLAQAHFDVAAADLAFRHAAGTFPPK
jgi:outer membrane protein TolC